MLLGEHEHTLDDKNRLTLPAKFREAFAGGLVLTRGMDGCVIAYPRHEWNELIRSRLGDLDPLSPEGRRMHRYFFSGATEDAPDKQGRVTVPPALKSHAGLERDVVVAGVLNHLEIWDRAAWRKELKEFEGSAEDVAQRLAAERV